MSQPHPESERRAATLRVELHERGRDSEAVWGIDLGPAPGSRGARWVRIANVPFLRRKPTWGDEVIATRSRTHLLRRDLSGHTWQQALERGTARDGGLLGWVLLVRAADRDRHRSEPRTEVSRPTIRRVFDALNSAGCLGERGFGERGWTFLGVAAPSRMHRFAIVAEVEMAVPEVRVRAV